MYYSKFARFTRFTVHYMNLLQYMTKMHNKNLLLNFKYCIMIKLYSEVNGPERSCNFMTVYICVSIVREVSIQYCLFTSVRKVQHCTGYPLIQVEIVSVCKSHYVCWLAPQSSLLIFLILECVVIFRLFPVWVQVQLQVV